MNFKSFFKQALFGTALLAFSVSLGLMQPLPAEAIKLGGFAGKAVEIKKINDSLNYYENQGRDELFEQIKLEDGVNEDPTLNGILDKIMTRLTDGIAKSDPSIKEKPYNYFINPFEYFNAYCTLGHNISINSAVFYFFNNHEDRIAAVVAHEMAHGQKKHPINGAKKKLAVDAGVQLFGDNLKGPGVIGVNILANQVKTVGVTKTNEWEADNVAFTYMVDAGYNVGAPAAVWQRVMDNTKDSGSKSKDAFSDILNPSTHPDNNARRDNYAKKMTEFSKNKVTVDSATGEVKINGKVFMQPTAAGNMSGAERAYLVAGNLARIYHDNDSLAEARNDGGVVRIGDHAVVTPASGDTSADELVRILNEIK